MPRFRERVAFERAVPAALQVASPSSWLYTSATERLTKSIQDELTPMSLSILRSGGVLPYQPVSIKFGGDSVFQPMDYTFFDPPGAGGAWNTRGTYYFPWPFDPAIAVPEDDAAAISFVTNAAIADAKSETYDALTSIAESGKSVEMIRRRTVSLYDLAFKKGRVATEKHRPRKGSMSPSQIALLTKRRLEEFNSLWLEARYGWRPLLLDIQNAYDQYREVKRTRNEGRAKAVVPISVSASNTNNSTATTLFSNTFVATGTRTYRGFALADGTFGQVGQLNPLVTGYELIPYSFVFDWLIDMGSYLQASTPVPGLDVRASGYSISDQYETVTTMPISLKPAQTVTLQLRQAQSRVTTASNYRRVPSGAVLPRFFPRLTTLRTIDILSLVLARNRSLMRLLYRV